MELPLFSPDIYWHATVNFVLLRLVLDMKATRTGQLHPGQESPFQTSGGRVREDEKSETKVV